MRPNTPLDLARPWLEHPLVVIDFETTGVDPLTCGAVSVGAVRYEAGVEVGQYYSLLRPECPIPAEAAAIHGITDEMVADAPALVDVAHHLCELAAGAVPCAYNSTYDRTILHRGMAGTDCHAFDPRVHWLCALVVIRDVDRYVRGTGRHKLEATCRRWGVELDGAHNALADARATGGLIHKLADAGKIVRTFALGKLLGHVEARRVQQEADFAAYRERMAREQPRAEQTKLPMGGA